MFPFGGPYGYVARVPKVHVVSKNLCSSKPTKSVPRLSGSTLLTRIVFVQQRLNVNLSTLCWIMFCFESNVLQHLQLQYCCNI